MRPRSLLLLAALALVVARPRPAAAGGAKTLLAEFFTVDEAKVTSATGYRVTGVSAYTHIVVGSYLEAGYEQRIVALATCDDRRCTGQRVWLGAFEVHLFGIVDLAGKPGPLHGSEHYPPHGGDWTAVLAGNRARWPALIIETHDDKPAKSSTRFGKEYSGTERHHDVLVISLRKAEQASPRIAQLSTQDTYPSGGGTTTDYRLEKGKQRALDIVASEQHHLDNDSACIEPDPVEIRYVLKDGRYQHFDPMLGRSGCH